MDNAGAVAADGTGAIARRAERFWRQIGMGISFSLFGIGGLFLALLVFPFINLFFRDPVKRAAVAQHLVHQTWKLFLRVVVFLGVLDFETQDEELLRRETGTLVIANHPSLLDVVLVMSLMERTQCVVKPGVWRNPFMRGVVRASNYIPNLGDPEKTLQDCVAALQSGNNLVIFPEGSRTVPGQPVHLERGFANIAIRAGVPIRLVSVTCDPPMLRKGEKWYQAPLRKPCYRIRVCERVTTERLRETEAPSRAARILTTQMTRRFEEMINGYA